MKDGFVLVSFISYVRMVGIGLQIGRTSPSRLWGSEKPMRQCFQRSKQVV